MLTAFMWEKAVGPIRRALEQFGDETANLPASPWPGIFMRKPGSLGVGFSSCYFLKHSEIGISERIEIFPARDLAKTGSRARSCHA